MNSFIFHLLVQCFLVAVLGQTVPSGIQFGSNIIEAGAVGRNPPKSLTVSYWIRVNSPSVPVYGTVNMMPTSANSGWISGFLHQPPNTVNRWVFSVITPTAIRPSFNLNGPSATLNCWIHFAGTYNGSTLRMYLNGALVASSTITGDIYYQPSTVIPLTIGGSILNNNRLAQPSVIRQLRIYSVARSASQILKDMDWDFSDTETEGLRYYFPLNDGPNSSYVVCVTNQDWTVANSNRWRWWNGLITIYNSLSADNKTIGDTIGNWNLTFSNSSSQRDGIFTNQGIFFRNSCASRLMSSTDTKLFLYFVIAFKIATNQSGGVIFESQHIRVYNTNDSKIEFRVKNASITHDTIITDQKWHQVILIHSLLGRSTSSIRIIIDGQTTPNITVYHNNSLYVELGNKINLGCPLNINNGSFFRGYLRDFRIYEGTLNITNINDITSSVLPLVSPYFGLTTSPFTTSPLTTSPLTTSPLTTSPLTTSPLTTSPLTTGEITTGEITSGELTSGEITTGELTTAEITTSELTTSPTTNEMSTAEMTSTEPTGEITSSQITTYGEIVTTGSLNMILTSGDKSSDSAPIALIAGIVGGVVGLLLIIISFIMMKRKSKGAHQLQESESEELKPIHAPYQLQNILIVTKVGSGNYGDVFKGKWEEPISGTKLLVALKKLKNMQHALEFERETAVLMSLRSISSNCKNIVKFFGLYSADDAKYIVLEYVNGGSLLEYIRTNQDLAQIKLLELSVEACKGMVHLEENSFIHRDVSARNFLVNIEDSETVVKVSDFGMARTGDMYQKDEVQIPIRWSAPEVIAEHKFSIKSDVWSFGVTLWEIFSYGRIPFTTITNAEAAEAILRGEILQPPKGCNESIYPIMQNCWHQNPSDRPKFADLFTQLEVLLPKKVVEEKENIYEIGVLSTKAPRKETLEPELYNNFKKY